MSDIAKFTPGPWGAADGSTTGRKVVSLAQVAKAKRNVAHVGGPDRDANAHLIAAAPELYEALELVLDTYGFDSSTDSSTDSSIWQTVTAALAKARGEA